MSSLLSNFVINTQGQSVPLSTYVSLQTNAILQVPTVGTTLAKYTCPFERNTVIRASDILASIAGYPINGAQQYSFGPTQRQSMVATCIAGNNFLYSMDSVNWSNIVSGVFTTGAYTVAYNGTIWISGGSGGNTLAYSYNGMQWTGLGRSVFAGGCKGLEWNGKIWVSNGYGGGNALAYSVDGINWTGTGNVAINNPDNAGTVKWNGAVFLASGYTFGANALAYSSNGVNWTGVSIRSVILRVSDVAWTGRQWYAAGTGGNTIVYTEDPIGATGWTAVGTLFGTAATSVDWNGIYMVAAGNATQTIGYSMNPATSANWTTITPAVAPFTTNAVAVRWDGTRWVGLGVGGNAVGFSLSGSLWNGYGTFNTISNTYPVWVANSNRYRPHTITFSRTTYVMGGNGTSNTLAYSYDGFNWVGLARPVFTYECSGIDYNGQVFVASGNGGNCIAVSNDGISWQGLGTAILQTYAMCTVWTGSVWLVGGTGGNLIAWSSDGYTWQGVSQVLQVVPATSFCNRIGISSQVLVIATSDSAGNTLAYTTDLTGRTGWTGLGHSVFSTRCRGVLCNGQIWVAVGQGTYPIAYSYNGISWTGVSTSITTNGYAVAWNGQMWVVVGTGGSSSTMYSYDGIVWQAGTNIFSSGGYEVEWINGKWIAGGGGTNKAAWSTNGTTWTAFSSSTSSLFSNYAYAFSWTAGKPSVYIQQPVITGSTSGTGNTLAYSQDGVKWTGLGTSVFASRCNGLGWNGLRWTACGSFGNSFGNSLATSLDGYLWQGLGNSVFQEAQSCAWNGSVWVAVGTDSPSGNTGKIAYSADGVSWNGVIGTTVFTITGEAVAWNGSYWLAGGAGGNALAWSPQGGTVWTGVAGSSALLNTVSSIATNGYVWVVSSSSVGLAYSYDITGATGWNVVSGGPFSAGSNTVAFNGRIWVAGGSGNNTIAWSQNGTQWVGLGLVAGGGSVNSVCWNGQQWLSTGTGGTYVSINGLIWSPTINGPVVGNTVCSNPCMGASVVDSTIVLNSTAMPQTGIATTDLEFIGQPYNQPGVENVSIRVNSLNVYYG